MKPILFLTLILLSFSLVSAITIYSGESTTIELEEPFDYYSIIGNTSEVVLDIIQQGLNVTITPSKYSQNDSYEIVFFNKEKETITVYSGGGGGGGHTRYVNKYINQTTTEYIEKECEKEECEKEEEVSNRPFWVAIGTLSFLVLSFIILEVVKFRRFNRDERGYEDEEED
jgi:hypothetical protein